MTDINAKLDSWKQSLLDSSDPLLDLSGDAVRIAGDPIRLAFVLGAGGGLELDASMSDELVASLKRRARAAEADGDHVLWLGLGLLRWASGRLAPIVLWPVALAADGRLVHAEGKAPRVNDVLAHALRSEHDSILETTGELDLAAVLRNAGAVADAQPDWGVERVARLVTCSFAKFELWRDAAAHDLAASPAIAYFTGATAAPALPAASSFDVVVPLDADASQLAAIAAAGAGGSFVVHGAPGTGKSQTIANLVVHCASHGKTVLVVADREPALDTIYDQLVALGLGEFCLPLHGDYGSPVRALDSLGRAVDRAFRPGSGPSGELARLGELRGALDAHRHAMHGKTPIGMTVYDVLARLVELRTTPCAALAEHDAPAHDRARFQQRLAAVTAFADAAKAVEPVAAHPWRASEFTAWTDAGVARARLALETSRDAAAALDSGVAEVAALVPGVVANTPDQLRALGTLCDLAAASPRPGAELLTNPRSLHEDVGERVALIRARGGGVLDTPREPGELLAIAARQRALAAELDETFTDAVAALDVTALWAQLKRWTTSMAALRYVALRAVRAEVRAAALPGKAETDEAMLAALECAIAERACRAALEAAAEPARRWFGDLGKGAPLALDLEAIDAAVAWGAELKRAFDRIEVSGGEAGRRAAWRALVAQVSASPDAAADSGPFARVAEAVGRWDSTLTELAAACGLRPEQLGAGHEHLPSLRHQVAMLLDSADAIADWARFDLARRAATIAGVGPAIVAIERGDLAAEDVAGSWERATLLAWLETEMRAVPALARFAGQLQHERAAAFVDVDRGSHALARSRAIARLAERAPRMSRLAGLDEDPELNALRKARAETKPRPLAALLAELPTLLGKVAPCVLATPRALAQHLAPGLPMFDVVVFDDASRLPAAYAMGALARGKAAVVFGDAQQCAPASGAEGLFAAALAAGMPALTLAAHYRSRHEDLFAFANRRYYDARIEQRPAPQRGAMGISWLRVEGAPDDTGANRAEAEAIVAEVVARCADPSRRGRSLAIAVMARAQEELIEGLLAAAKLPADRGAIIVATPDRLQGLEMDDALVSLGGTPEAFGALALAGGDAWLAVATTRARERMTIVGSFDPELIPDDAPAAVRSLAELTAFARAGGGAARPADGGTPVTAITAAIARALGERGWTVHHGVGVGPYRIALAVVDPADATRYVLAIEDDGPAYASAAGARDRDRLRVQELTRLGWRVHRMWALDWWNDAEREIQRAHGAIVAAIAAQRARTLMPTVPPARERRVARGSMPAPMRTPTTPPPSRRRAVTPSLSPSRAPLQLPLIAPPDTAPMAIPVEVAAGSGPTDLGPSDTAAVEMVPAGATDITARAPLATAAAAASATAIGSAPTAVPSTDLGAADTAEIAAVEASALAAGMMMPLEASASAPLRLPRGAIGIGPYIAAAIPAGRRAPDDMFAPRHLAELGKVVEKVLAAEAPIHVELLARRVGAYFGIGKVTERIVQQVRGVLAGRGRYGDEAGIVWRLDQDPASVPAVRVTSTQGFRRAIAEVPLAEVAAAARIVVERGHDVATQDLVRDCARLLGFARITDQVTARVQQGVRLATMRELIAVDAGRARMPV